MGSIQMKGAILNNCAIIDVDMTHIVLALLYLCPFFAGPGQCRSGWPFPGHFTNDVGMGVWCMGGWDNKTPSTL